MVLMRNLLLLVVLLFSGACYAGTGYAGAGIGLAAGMLVGSQLIDNDAYVSKASLEIQICMQNESKSEIKKCLLMLKSKLDRNDAVMTWFAVGFLVIVLLAFFLFFYITVFT